MRSIAVALAFVFSVAAILVGSAGSATSKSAFLVFVEPTLTAASNGLTLETSEPPQGQGSGGILATAGRVLFTGDGGGNFVAFDATNGNPLWHSRIGSPSNAPETYMQDGQQYVVIRDVVVDPAQPVTIHCKHDWAGYAHPTGIQIVRKGVRGRQDE